MRTLKALSMVSLSKNCMEQKTQQPTQEKTENKSSIKTNWKLFAIVASIVVVSVGLILLWPQLKIDKCLDRGGVWDYENSDCIAIKPVPVNGMLCDLDGDGGCDQTDYKVFVEAIHGCVYRGPIRYIEGADADRDGCVTPVDENILFPEIVQKRETANWQTYRNDEFGFEVKYPLDWSEVDGALMPTNYISRCREFQSKPYIDNCMILTVGGVVDETFTFFGSGSGVEHTKISWNCV